MTCKPSGVILGGVILGSAGRRYSRKCISAILGSCVVFAVQAMLEQVSLLLNQMNSLFEDREKQLEEVRSRKHLDC